MVIFKKASIIWRVRRLRGRFNKKGNWLFLHVSMRILHSRDYRRLTSSLCELS